MKTMAIRLDDDQHAQLSVLAQLEGITVTDFIRSAIDARLEAKRTQPDLAAKAEQVLADIDAEAQNRRSAIATLFAPPDDEDGPTPDSEAEAKPDPEAKPEPEAKPAGRGRTRRTAGSGDAK